MAFDSTNFEKPQVDEVGQIILKAREYLSVPAHWCSQGGGHGASMCIHIALVEVCGYDTRLARPAVERVAVALGDKWGDATTIHAFNDDPNTTHADVLALLDRAAKGGQP